MGAFGLVWDGPSIKTCCGGMGEYLKYNSPHKFSLYLASLVPVIVWSQAAVADIVKDYGIGLVVDSLDELEQVLPSITVEEYNRMIDNIKPIQCKLLQGHFLYEAVKKAESII